MQYVAGRRPWGAWSWDVGTDRWSWDESISRLHGFGPPGSPPPGSDLVILQTARPDRRAIQDLLAQLRRDPSPFAAVLRIRTATGRIVPVVVTGAPDRRRPRTLSGWLVPIEYGSAEQGTVVAELESQVANLHRALDTRDLIGRAKGILQARMGLGDLAAFDVLSQLSQNTNVRLVTVAERLVAHADTVWPAEPDGRDVGDALHRLVVHGPDGAEQDS